MSSSKSSQQTQTASSVTQLDNRVGIEGQGNVLAQEGASVSIVNNDVSFDVVDAATRANAAVSLGSIESSQESARIASSLAARAIEENSATLDTSLRAQVAVSGAAISASQESARVAGAVATQVSQAAISSVQEANRITASAILQGQDRALDTAERSLDTADRSVMAVSGIAENATDAARAIVSQNNELTEKTRQGNQELVKLVADKLSTAVADERQNINAKVIDSAYKYGAAAVAALAIIFLVARRKSA